MIVRVQKTLSPNDMGDTRSHQAGIHVPKSLVHFFPALNESALNPRLERATAERAWLGWNVCIYPLQQQGSKQRNT